MLEPQRLQIAQILEHFRKSLMAGILIETHRQKCSYSLKKEWLELQHIMALAAKLLPLQSLLKRQRLYPRTRLDCIHHTRRSKTRELSKSTDNTHVIHKSSSRTHCIWTSTIPLLKAWSKPTPRLSLKLIFFNLKGYLPRVALGRGLMCAKRHPHHSVVNN